MSKKIAIIGTNGIPANYGGFETLAENIVLHLSNYYVFYVYCSKIHEKSNKENYNNTKLVYIPLNANGIQSIVYDTICFMHALINTDIILFLGPTPSGIITILNLFFRKKIIINHGGLNEWERKKYSYIERKWAKINHCISAKLATINVADNLVLKKSLYKNFNVNSIVIRYGGDHKIYCTNKENEKYSFTKSKYFLCIARAQIDNNLELIIEGIKKLNTHPLVIISNWSVSAYGKNLKKKYNDSMNLILLDAIYDQEELNQIRSKCYIYIHSHSYCGTSPSLVEAMNMNIPIVCFDVPTNRETTRNKSKYFSTSIELSSVLKNITLSEIDEIRANMYTIARNNYTWSKICEQYRKLFD